MPTPQELKMAQDIMDEANKELEARQNELMEIIARESERLGLDILPQAKPYFIIIPRVVEPTNESKDDTTTNN